MKCLILAGGFGTRLYPMTMNRAKTLLEYEGKPLLTHIVENIPRDIPILIATNRKFEAEFLSWQKKINRPVEICFEEACRDEEKRGAVGALHFWIEKKAIKHDLLVIAGDNYFGFDLTKFIATYNGKEALVAVHDIGDKSKAVQFGVVKLEKNRIVEFEEKPARPKSTLIATALYILPSNLFPTLARYCSKGGADNLGSFISYLVSTNNIHAYVFTEAWFDIGSKF